MKNFQRPKRSTQVEPTCHFEDLLGSYRTKCLFSKNWILREAAMTKTIQLAQDLISSSDGKCAEAMFSIIELGVDDKNAQVYQSALILVRPFTFICLSHVLLIRLC